MWNWLFRRQRKPAGEPREDAEGIRRKLAAAHLVVEAHRKKCALEAAEKQHNNCQEILPSSEPDAVILYTPFPPPPGNSATAAALESILQGHRVDSELFTQLFRCGFVLKDPAGKWAITSAGKELIERHKLLTSAGTFVAGVRAAAGWQ